MTWSFNLWLSYLAGSQLIILAILRLVSICRNSQMHKERGLLPHFAAEYEEQAQQTDCVYEADDEGFPLNDDDDDQQ